MSATGPLVADKDALQQREEGFRYEGLGFSYVTAAMVFKWTRESIMQWKLSLYQERRILVRAKTTGSIHAEPSCQQLRVVLVTLRAHTERLASEQEGLSCSSFSAEKWGRLCVVVRGDWGARCGGGTFRLSVRPLRDSFSFRLERTAHWSCGWGRGPNLLLFQSNMHYGL